ncbi:MAG: hypothetical protein HY909_09825 [Deltaproteobacteria bacterium]|nr:hypothetical protein [Deltaproteobacteria bacterium]
MSALTEGRGLHVLAACALAVAALGLGADLGGEPAPARRPRPVFEEPGQRFPRAPTHEELSLRRSGENRARHAVAFAGLQQDRPARTEELPFDPVQRAAAVRDRASRRAYDGAPPTIPHAVDSLSLPVCLTCHAEGMRLRGHVAPAMPHDTRASCTQCHVVDRGPVPGEEPSGGPPLDNTFAGAPSVGRGERAWPGAPPTIPHATLQRGRCESCHGALSAGLRTSHPWRQSCTQCHAPSAALDFRAVPGLGPAAGEAP